MSAPLWTSAEIADASGGRATRAFEVGGVSIDSREIAQGDLFIALKDARDGHDFVAAALAAGAAGALVSRIPEGVPADAPLVVVGETLEGLRALGAAARARTQAKVIAVTGSVGKTSTKEMLRAALAGQGRTHAAVKSFNNHWGVPLTLARAPRDADYIVAEIGMNHAGEIRPLTKLARPHAAIVTTVAPVHLAAFRNEAGIAFAKAEIFEGLEPGGAAILNRDNAHYRRLVRRARRVGVKRILRFGAAPRCHARLLEARVCARCTTVRAQFGDHPLLYKIGAPGGHMARNSLAVLLAVEAVGGDIARAAMALAAWTAPEGRGARWSVALDETGLDGRITLIDESYNANPASMSAALEVLAASKPDDDVGRLARGRRIAFLGDMLELGPDEAAMHAGLARDPSLSAVDKIHCAGPRMRALHKALPADRRGEWRASSAELAKMAKRLLDAGDVAMVKGSLGARMIHVVDAIKTLGRARPASEHEEGS